MPIFSRKTTQPKSSRRIRPGLLTAVSVILLASACAEVVPILTAAAVNFGKNLVDTASQNAGAKYGSEVEQLILALAYKALQAVPAGQTGTTSGYDIAASFGSYAGPAFHTNSADPYASDTFSRGVALVGPVELDVALLARREASNGAVTLEPVQDGDTLHDGRGDPQAGDKIKVAFKANCDCHVYIIGIDATGHVAQIFPDPDTPALSNPVQADMQYMMPEGEDWWGLDEFRGTETIYFVASPRQRQDIEQAIGQLRSQSRSVSPEDYQPVTEAAVVPLPRGLVKVSQAAAIQVATTGGAQQTVTPTAFLSNTAGADLVITRWFNHQ